MRISFAIIFFPVILFSCKNSDQAVFASNSVEASQEENENAFVDLTDKQRRVSEAAISIIDPTIVYDPTYFRLDYPNGDVPAGKGVCTDVVIRTYRKLGVDFQKEIHEDMKSNFHLYPKIWGLTKPDSNIDHRRVPNLMTYFSRFGTEKPMSQNPKDYAPGDIICWKLPNGMTHIGVMIHQKSSDGIRYLIVHNIGQGQIPEDILFEFDIIGHYSYENFD